MNSPHYIFLFQRWTEHEPHGRNVNVSGPHIHHSLPIHRYRRRIRPEDEWILKDTLNRVDYGMDPCWRIRGIPRVF